MIRKNLEVGQLYIVVTSKGTSEVRVELYNDDFLQGTIEGGILNGYSFSARWSTIDRVQLVPKVES